MYKYNYAILSRYTRTASFLFLLALLGFTSPVFATNFYVDRNASGNGSGTSWANASTKLSSLNWSNISAGDTIFISGGTDSLVYPPDQIANKAISGSSYVVITPGRDTGHNGEVIYAPTSLGGWGLFINTCNNIKITGLKFECLIDTTGGYGNTSPAATIFRSSYNTNIVLDNCHLIGNGMGQPVTIEHSSKITLTNNIIENLWNNTDINQDPIGIGVGSGGHTITGNVIIHRMLGGVGGSYGAHGDIMQIYNEGSPDRLKTTIANNLMVYIRPPGTVDGSAMVYIEGSHSQEYLIYNNILLNKGDSPINDIVLTNNGGYSVSAKIYNNDILNHNATGDGSAIGNVDTLLWKNNIYYLDNSCHTPLISIGSQAYKEIDYNNWTSVSPVNIMGQSWSSWQSSGFDTHGDINPVSFQNVWGTGVDDYTLEGSSIDQGTLLSTFNNDIDDIIRPQGSAWDRGALEKVQGGGGNNPPVQPSNPQPLNAAIDQSVDVNLAWVCSDPDGDPLAYDVYFGTSSNPPLVSGNQSAANYDPGQLGNGTTYYWKITAKDNHGGSTAGPVWHFSTVTAIVNNPPAAPSNPNPVNGAVDQSVNVNVSWSCTDPENDPLTYDVYFGTSSNPAQVSNNQSGTTFDPGQLANSTTYYWKIVAQDDHGNSTAGAVWHFTTAAGFVNTPPAQPSNPNPVNAAENQDTILTVSWNCSDPDGDTLTYDVYFGTGSNPPLVSANQSAKNYNPGTLTTGTTYYWKIIAKDNHNTSTAGPEWHFTTVTQGTNTFATIELKFFLEGPYTSNAMGTQLEENSLIPLSQPYSQLPWAYNGNEEVSQMPANIVDWVLLELRNTTTNVVARHAVLLRNDGRITELDGSERVNFPNVPGGQYYVVVYHRNHLAVMSKNPLQLSDSTALYDFSNSQDKAYGSGAMKDLGNGKFGLFAADGNGNGNVNNADNNSVWKKENGSVGYEQGDYDMNGGVTIVDKNSKWKPNNGKSTQVP